MPTPCITCDYDLQGLPDTALCPECATPVSRSLADRRLRNADIKWLTTTTIAAIWLARCIAWPVYAFLGFFLLSMGFGMIMAAAFAGGGPPDSTLMLVLMIGLGGIQALAALFFVIAYIPFAFLVTTVQTHFASPIESERLPVRLTCWAPVALFVFLIVQRYFAPFFAPLPAWTPDLFLSVIVLVFALHDAFLRRALRALALRTDDFNPKRRKRHRNPMRHAVIIGAILFILVWFPYALAFVNNTPFTAISPVGRGLFLLAALLATASLHAPLKDTATALKAELRAARLTAEHARNPTPPTPTEKVHTFLDHQFPPDTTPQQHHA